MGGVSAIAVAAALATSSIAAPPAWAEPDAVAAEDVLIESDPGIEPPEAEPTPDSGGTFADESAEPLEADPLAEVGGGQQRIGPGEGTSLLGAAPAPFTSPGFDQQIPETSPSARTAAVMVFDPVRNQTVLFGGASGSSVLGGTFTWDGETWTQQSPAHSPSARSLAYAAFDSATSTVVLYGGWSGSANLSDTWTWDGTDWTQQSPAASPPARSGGAAAYLAANSTVVITGDTANSGTSWAWDGATWSQMLASGPSGRSQPALAADPASGKLLMYGGLSGATYQSDTWTWDGTTWASLSPAETPPGLAGATAVYNPTLQRVIMIGGKTAAATASSAVYAWDETTWRVGNVPVPLSARTNVGFAQTPENGQLLSFGGATPAGVALGDTQSFDWPDTGSRSGYTQIPFRLTDRTSVSVNPATGNLLVSVADLSVNGVGLATTISHTYNSRYQIADTTTGGLSSGWGVNGAPTSRVTTGLGTSDVYAIGMQGAGTVQFFPYSTLLSRLVSPPDLLADLADLGGGSSYELTVHASGEKITYSGANLPITTDEDKNGNTQTYTYSGGKLTSFVDTQGRSFTLAYSGNQITGITSTTSGRTVSYGYSGGVLTSATDPSGKVTTYGYTNGLLTSITGPSGATGAKLTFTYDAYSRVTGVTQITSGSSGYTTSFSYSAATAAERSATDGVIRKTLVVLPNQTGTGVGTTYQSNHSGQVLKTLDAAGNTRSNTFNPAGQGLTSTSGMSSISTLTYDNNNNLLTAQAPNGAGSGGATGRTSTLGYPTPSGTGPYPLSVYQPTSSQDANGNQTTYAYSTTGNLLTSTNSASGDTFTNEYEGDPGVTSCGGRTGQLCRAIDARGIATVYGYDAAGNNTTVTHPAPLGATTRTFDGEGRVLTVTDGRGNVTKYFYDNNDRITQLRWDGGTSTTCGYTDALAAKCVGYTYDSHGNLKARIDVSGNTGAWTYDALNRMKSYANNPINEVGSVTYDASSNITSVTGGTGSGATTLFYYNNLNQLRAQTVPYSTASCPATPTFPNTSRCIGYTYDANGQRTSVTYPSGQKIDYTFDTSQRITKIESKRPSGALIVSREYSYTDASGNDTSLRQWMKDQTGAQTNYTYDTSNRLTSAVTGSTTLGYAYDPAGNMTQATKTGSATIYYGVNDANQMCWSGTATGSNGTTACPATPTGNTSYTYDADGNQTGSGTTSMAYNTHSQNTSITIGSTTTNFKYTDIDNTQRYQAGSVQIANGLLGIYAASGFEHVVRDNNSNLVALRTSSGYNFYTLDAQGSVIAVTNEAGTAETALYTYDPFGKTTSSTGTLATTNPFRYASGWTDSSGLIKFGVRYYNPETARWTQRDPHSFGIGDPGQANRYNYVGNNPTNGSDPSGRWTVSAFGGGCLFFVCGSLGVSRDMDTGERSFDFSFGFGYPGFALEGGVRESSASVSDSYSSSLDLGCSRYGFGGSMDLLSGNLTNQNGSSASTGSCSLQYGGHIPLGV